MRDGWRRVALGDILKLRSERTHRVATLLSVTADRGVIRQSESGRRDSSSADKNLYLDVHPGDVVYNTMRMWQGVSGVAPEAGIVSPAYTVCRLKSEVHAPFMAFLLKDPRLVSQFYRNSQGLVSDTWNLRYREFKAIEIMLPPLEEQQRITDVLTEMDMQIARLGRLARKEQIARRSELFTQFSRAATVKYRVRDLLKSRPRNGFSPKEADAWNGTLMLGLGCLTPAGFSPKQLKFAPEGIDRHHRTILRDGDLLVSRANTRELVGLAGVYRDVGNPCIYPDLMMRLEPVEDVPSEMLELALSIPESRRCIQAQAQGTSESMAKIACDVITNLEVPMPDREGGQRLMRILDDVNRSGSVYRAAIQKATDIKKGLMADLVARAVSCVSHTLWPPVDGQGSPRLRRT